MERQFFVVWVIFSLLEVAAEPTISKNDIETYSLHVDCKITSRFAHTIITSRVVNKANESKEALFEVELPKTAFITNFSMTIDGKTYPGIIKEKKSAQVQYDAAVAQGQSAGLVKSTGRKLEQFHVSVNVAAAGKVTFELIYEELLKRKLGNYELLIKVKPKQLVNHFQIDAHIFEPQGISFLDTESTFITNELRNALTKVQDETKAHISFKPTITQQRKSPESEETLLDGDFIIRYDVKRDVAAGDIQIVNGYFVHYFAPSQMPSLPKNVIFVIDRSGSMHGKKIVQTREALNKILDDLNPEDHFNFVIFSGDVTEWQPSLLQATEENVRLAKRYVETIFAQGGTDINGALLTAINSLDKATASEKLPDQSVSMIILLTDGDPTAGITDPAQIQNNIKEANGGKYFIYCLGFGFDVIYAFLEKMALENGGIARRIYQDSDSALQLQDFYHEIATPILKEIEIKYPDNAAIEISKNNFKLLFEGSEIVVAGKVGNEIDAFPVEINARALSNEIVLKEEVNVKEKEQVFQQQKYIFGNYIERLWAHLTIQQLLEESVSAEGEQKRMLDAQALALALKFALVTPLTALVVTKPDADEVANKPTEADNENSRHSLPRIVSGYPQSGSGATRLFKGQAGLPGPPRHPVPPRPPSIPMASLIPERLRIDTSSDILLKKDLLRPLPDDPEEYPHFILPLLEEGTSICLNILGDLQTPKDLFSDPEKGIHITGMLGENRHFIQFQIDFQRPDLQVDVTAGEIALNKNSSKVNSFLWSADKNLTIEGLQITLEREKNLLQLQLEDKTIQIFSLSLPLNFLGLNIIDDNRSDRISGLLGQFYNDAHSERSNLSQRRKRSENITVQGKVYTATRDYMKDFRIKPGRYNRLLCWLLEVDS